MLWAIASIPAILMGLALLGAEQGSAVMLATRIRLDSYEFWEVLLQGSVTGVCYGAGLLIAGGLPWLGVVQLIPFGWFFRANRAMHWLKRPRTLAPVTMAALNDPATVMGVHMRLASDSEKARLEAALKSKLLTFPPCLATVKCPSCWAAFMMQHHNDLALQFMDSWEAAKVHDPTVSLYMCQGVPHTDCPFNTEYGDNYVYLAYLNKCYRNWLSKSLSEFDFLTTTEDVPTLEGGKKGQYRQFSGGNDIYLVPKDDTREDRDRLLAHHEATAMRLAELNMYEGDGRGDGVLRLNLERELRSIERALRGTDATSSTDVNPRARMNMDFTTREATQRMIDTGVGASWADLEDEADAYYDAEYTDDDDRDSDQDYRGRRLEGVKASATRLEGVRDELRALREKKAFENSLRSLVAEHEAVAAKLWKTESNVFVEAAKMEGYKAHALAAERLREDEEEEWSLLQAHHLIESHAAKRRVVPAPVAVLPAASVLEASGKIDPIILCDDEKFTLCDTQEGFERFKALMDAQSQQAVRDHHEEVRKLLAYTASQQKGAKPRKPGSYPVLESHIPGSTRQVEPRNVGVVSLARGARRHCVVEPYGQSKEPLLCVITIRHCYSDEAEDFVDGPAALGEDVAVLLRSDVGELKGKVVSIFAPEGKDLHFMYTDIPAGSVPLMRRSRNAPKNGQVLVWTCHPDVAGVDQWGLAPGQFVGIDESHVYYTATTMAGDCGAPIYNHQGQVVAIHTDGGTIFEGIRCNAGLLIGDKPPQPKAGSCVLPPYKPRPVGLSLLQATRGTTLVSKAVAQFRGREQLKVQGLRPDKNHQGLIPKHIWAKPSTAMNHLEVQKYGMPTKCKMDKALWQQACTAALLYDVYSGPCETPFIEPTAISLLKTLNDMDLERSSGPSGESLKATEYLTVLGQGDLFEGKLVLVERVQILYRAILRAGPQQDWSALNDEELEVVTSCATWQVIGKLDGYKFKKLPAHDPPGSGRTIQAPSLELKVLWKCCFGFNDDLWGKRDNWIHSGEDLDMPITHHHRSMLARALGSIATDMTGFDREMMDFMIDSFFTRHLSALNPGVPEPLLTYLAMVTVAGPLLMSDGIMYTNRKRGNPSGFMNTLRLNCFAHIASIAYFVMHRRQTRDPEEVAQFMSQSLHIQICGDDSRIFAMDEEAVAFLDLTNAGAEYIRDWQDHSPWDMKLEGMCYFDPTDRPSFEQRLYQFPPMVSRRYILVGGVVFEPLYNISRLFKRLASSERREPAEEEALVQSAAMTCALHIYWQVTSQFYSPAISYLLREFLVQRGGKVAYENIFRRIAKLHGHIPRQRAPAGGHDVASSSGVR
jgi:hypothetical protein